jgi:tRNA1(Val) A37 N6-methylase TrmN6
VPEPERWTKEDLTLDEQYSTAKKEAQAALHEAKIECQAQASFDQITCLSQAKNEYDREMAAINKRFGLPE